MKDEITKNIIVESSTIYKYFQIGPSVPWHNTESYAAIFQSENKNSTGVVYKIENAILIIFEEECVVRLTKRNTDERKIPASKNNVACQA